MTSGQHPLANRYSLIRQLAAGSYAETWLGNDGALDRYVAVKLLHTTDADPEERTQEFLQEARIAAAVSHANIVAVYDAGEEDGSPFLVMEWVNGDSLKQEIISSRRITPERALDVTAELLDGLSAIHAQGIIHRDVKPQNIMVNEFGTIKLTDFGIARMITESDGRADGTTAGSAAYMAPEQAQGMPVSPASDIYAAGVIMYEMLTGRLPFRHDDPQQVLLQHINDPVPRPRRTNPSIPPQVEAIILKALEKDPADRFNSADEMRKALLIARTHLPVRRPVTLSVPESPESRFPLQRLAWAAASIALIVVAIAGATSLAVLDFGTSQSAAESNDNQTEISEVSSETEPEPVVASEPTATAQAAPGGPPDPPYSVYENEFRVRGEVVVEAPPETGGRINRQAPNRPATDDEMNEEEETTAQTQQPAAPPPAPAPPPPPPSPTPVPQVEPESTATPEPVPTETPGDDGQTDQDSDAPGNSDDNPGQDAGNGNGDGNGNGNGQGNGSTNDDDPPASGQGQGQGQNNDDDEAADPQSSDDDDADSERDDADSLVASENDSSEDASDDDDVADLNDSNASERDDSNTSEDDDDAASDNSDDASDRDNRASGSSDDDDAELNSSGSNSSDDQDAAVEDDDDAIEDEDSDEAELLMTEAPEKTNGSGSSDKDDDEKTRDRDDRVKNSDDNDKEKKTRKPSRNDRPFERFINRFSVESAA